MKKSHAIFLSLLPLAALSCGQASAADQKSLGVNPYDFLVYTPSMPQRYEHCKPNERGDRYNDHFQVLYDANRKTYFAFWTQASKEADKDMHIVFSQSADLKSGWTKPIVLAGCERRSEPCAMAYWQQPMLSAKGRLYCLWNQQVGTNRCHYGIMRGRYSDDAGVTWSAPADAIWPTNVLRNAKAPSGTPPNWCIWQRPLRFGPGGSYFVGVTHHSSRVGFISYTNIDDNPEIADIGFRFYHATPDTYLKAPRGLGGSCCEEASVVKLPDGRLFALLRSRMGHPIWTQSRDGGCTWQATRPLEKPNGEKFLHCCSPCPMYDWKGCEAGSGTYFALIHNTYDFSRKDQVRGPLYLIAGTFDPTGEQPIRFAEPKLFAPRKAGNSFYASYTVDENGVGILWFNDMKYWLLGRKVERAWFCP